MGGNRVVEHTEKARFQARQTVGGAHRELVGGLWDEIGRLQFDFLCDRGLRSNMRLLDIGCGCFRGGRYFVDYLDAGNYYGIDADPTLLETGYDLELAPAGLASKLPRSNLACVKDFDVSSFQTTFDFALAQSVFTHIDLTSIRLCMGRLAKVMKQGGVFYATFFQCPERTPFDRPLRHVPAGIVTLPAADPYHYYFADLAYVASNMPWRVEYIGDWGHPRGQKMAAFHKEI